MRTARVGSKRGKLRSRRLGGRQRLRPISTPELVTSQRRSLSGRPACRRGRPLVISPMQRTSSCCESSAPAEGIVGQLVSRQGRDRRHHRRGRRARRDLPTGDIGSGAEAARCRDRRCWSLATQLTSHRCFRARLCPPERDVGVEPYSPYRLVSWLSEEMSCLDFDDG